MRQLDRISQPADLKHFSLHELERLAEEIRQRIIEVLSVNGGHLSSNLGIVELTIALHRVFQAPQDRFIFDVSHQTYPHKIVTGRNHLFERIRKYGGLCGFCHPKESPHDHFFAGHAGTAFSLALGVAKSRDLMRGREHVLPILGDASLTCGLTLEALNNVPKDLARFIVVLNDNMRSISENVGNIQHICPTSFFQEFGLRYVGPIDGHNLSQLLETFEQLREQSQPVLVHVMTVKGKGMPIAIANPTPYHGARPFDLCSGKFLPAPSMKPTFPKIFGKHLLKMADRDPSLITITPAMPAGSCLDELMQRYPERCVDVGIAEGHAVTFAGGIAKDRRCRVVACIYATFLQRALDNVFQDVCMQEVPVLFALDRAFLSGPDGSTHHGIYDIAFLHAMPNMVIAQPRDGHLLKELLECAFSWGRPAAIRYPNLETEEPDVPLQFRPLGRGEVLVQGQGVLLIALGHHCATALRVRELLMVAGMEATVVDPIFLKPLDEELFHRLLPDHSLIVTIEEHAVSAGLGMIFNSFLMQNGWKEGEVLNFGIPDRFMQFGSHKELLKEIGLDAESIASRILQELEQYDHCDLPAREEKALF
jgi:1-deoxy-D-xylulose-5-phosphate synthase